MRRVVVTPTFAAGLGVVVAAVLAYPMRTVFDYAAPNGATCKVVSCGTGSQAGGQPATGPSHHLKVSGHAGTHSGSDGSRSHASHGPAGGGGGGGAAAAPQLSYQTASTAQGGFAGTIVMTFKPKSAHQRWRLRFSYPSGRILRASAGRYIRVQHSRHTAVASWDSPAHVTFPRQVRVSVVVAGRPGPPRRCFFNGHGCHFGGRHAGQRGSASKQRHKSMGHSKPPGTRSRKRADAFG